jgi:hypothetical protein
MAQDPSKYEYTLKDYEFTAISKTGARFPFSDRVSEANKNPNESSSVGQGSGPNPVYHTRKVREPTVSITIPVDESTKFEKWFLANCADDEVCNMEFKRKKPRVTSVLDLVEDWLPRFGEEAIAPDAGTMVTIEGNALAIRKDVTNALQA